MATLDQLTPIPDTSLSGAEIGDLEAALGHLLPDALRTFLCNFGYASFIDIGFGVLDVKGRKAAFGQFYGKRPGTNYDPRDFDTGALRIGDPESHYPEGSLIFAGDELGGEYFFLFGQDTGVYWMIYDESVDFLKVCSDIDEFVDLIEVEPYDD